MSLVALANCSRDADASTPSDAGVAGTGVSESGKHVHAR